MLYPMDEFYTIKNGCGSAKNVFPVSDIVNSRARWQYLVDPNTKPKWFLPMQTALCINQVYKEELPTLDFDEKFQVNEGYYKPVIDTLAPVGGKFPDIITGSTYYFRIARQYERYLPPFYLDRLFIPRKVFTHDPDREPRKAKLVGCTLRAAMPPYPPSDYVRGINNFQDVSAASLKRCLMYYRQPEIYQMEYRLDGGLMENLAFLERELDRRLMENRNRPSSDFLISLSCYANNHSFYA